MNAVANVLPFEQKHSPAKLAADWGWRHPTEEILSIAEKSAHAQRTKSGQILVDWDIIDGTTRDKLLARKPSDAHTLQYFAEQEPVRVLQYVEQIVALKNGYPYYDRLSILSPHKEMESAAVIRRCDEIDAVLMLIESQVAVLVFSSWDAMLKYSVMGKTERNADPVIVANGHVMPQLAVGARDDISSVLKLHHTGGDNEDEAGSGGRVWHVKANDPNSTPEEREMARIFDHALAEKATDVSLKPLSSGAVEVYIRKFGNLIPAFQKSKGSGSKRTVIGSLIAAKAINLLQSKSGANPDRGRLREPDDGHIKYRSATADAFMRLNFIPLNHLGEYKELRSVSVRLFSRVESALRLNDLRIQQHIAQYLRDAVQMPQGLVLLSGPVNQGKSSTVAATIAEHVEIYGDAKKRVSIEDPIEREIPGVTQIQAPGHIKDPAERFNVILRALKRHDFNLLFVGEVRDAQSADFCVRFASSGHLVLSTIHAKDSILAFTILSEMTEAELRFQLVESMSLSVSQRLVSTVCPCCGIKNSAPTPAERRLFKLNLEMLGERRPLPATFTRANLEGCDECDGGYAGSMPICEILPFTRQVKDAIHALMDSDNAKEQRSIIAGARPVTLLQSGLDLVRAGLVDLRSIMFF